MCKIKLFTSDTDMSRVRMFRMNWDVVIDGIPYYVYHVPEFIHSMSGDAVHNYWMCRRDISPTTSPECMIAYDLREPVQWTIRDESRITITYKYSEPRTRLIHDFVIYRNNERFMHSYSLAEAQYFMEQISSHPMNFNEIGFATNAIGRKIWWRSEPAVITEYINRQGEIVFIPDGIDSFTTPQEYAHDDVPYYEEGQTSLHTSIFDKHICWFRE